MASDKEPCFITLGNRIVNRNVSDPLKPITKNQKPVYPIENDRDPFDGDETYLTKCVCIPFNPHSDPVYDVSDNLYDVRYNVYDVCGKTCDETDNVYDVRDKTSEKGVPTCGEGVPTVREGDFVEIYCPPGSGDSVPTLKSTVFLGYGWQMFVQYYNMFMEREREIIMNKSGLVSWIVEKLIFF